MTRTLSVGWLAIALVCVCAGPAYARGGHGHGHAHAHAHAIEHEHHSSAHTSSFRTHATVEHRASAFHACGYERSVCAEECRLTSAAVCARCNQDVARCEGGAY